MTFIINATSGTTSKESLVQRLQEHFGPEVTSHIHFTAYPNHASELAVQWRSESDLIIVAGGDGTVNEVARELIHQDNVALGIIPVGSGNGLARSLGISLRLDKALNQIKNGNISSIDTCTFNDVPFFCTAGLGFDASVAKDFDELPSRGIKTYIQACLRQYINFNKPTIQLQTENDSIDSELFMLTVANAEQFGYGAKISPNSSLSDGCLEVVMIKEIQPHFLADFGIKLFLGNLSESNYTEVLKVRNSLTIKTNSKLAHLDGDPFNFNGEASIKVIPRSLRVIS